MGKLSDVAKIVHVAMDFDALPAIAAANVIIQVPNVTVSHDFGLVDITGNLAYGSESGASFDLSGSGRLPGLASGVPFQMALLTDGDMIPLTLATQDRPLTLNSMLAGMRMQSAYGDLPQVPLLSSKLAEFLQIQIKNVVLFFCKPGAKSRGCVPRASINILVPSSLLSFDNSLLPVSLNDALLTVSMVDVFSSSRSLEFRITGKWNVAGVPLVLTVMRAPSEEQLDLTDYSGTDDQPSRRPRLAAREHVLDQDDSESDRDVELDADRGVVDDAVGSDRVAEDVVGLSGMPSIEVAGDDGLSDALPATDDSWVQFPDLSHTFSAGAGFFDVPLAHVNHHLYRTHLERRGLDPALAHRRHLLRNETTRTLQRREAKDESGAAHSKSRTVLAKARPTAARRVAKSPKRKPGVRVPKGSSGMWVVSAVAPSLQLGKLLDALSAKILPSGEVSDVVRSTGLDDFEIKDFGLMLVLGQKELFLRLSGSMDRLPGEPRVQIVVKREVGGSFEGAIALGAKGEIFSETMRKFVPGFELPGLDLVASGLTMGIIISSKTMELTNSALALYSPLDYIGSIHRGLELNLRMGLPKTCSGFCDVMKQLLGPDVGLQVMVIVDSSSVVLGAGVTDVKITDGLTLQSVKFEASFSKSAGAMMKLIGTLMLDVDSSQPPLIFDAYVGVKGASVLLGGKMKGIWRKAFGWDRLAVGNLVLEVGITAALGAPSILIGGEVAIGKNCYTSSDTFDLSNNKCFGGAVYIGTDPVNPQSNWFAGELNNVDLRHIIGAFTDNEPDESVFPKPLLNSGFPGKLQVSYCPAGGCEVPGHSFGMGFYLNGTINIFDVTARAEILVYPSKQIKLDFELSPLNLANGLIVAYYSKEDSSRGPRLKLDIEYARMDKATLLLNGYVKVFLFEVEAAIEISPTHYKIEFEASYFAFHASFLLQAQIGARLAFRMQAEFSMSHFQAFVDAVVKAVEGWAEDASKVMGKAKAGVESAQKKVNEVKNSVCEFRDRCQAAADAVKCKRRIKKRGLEGGQAGNRRSDRRMLGKRTSKGLDNRSEGGHHLEKRLGIIKSSFEKAFNW
ncbi:hypothetical protein DFJ74DRAFT_320982 [Hyaloraphidium curvatum]|nr:hypothetical protein DFJ74DRAFT_320982 [Hyaloraphidium curvatum]